MAAGLKNIKTHIKSISNIRRITASMKMVSASKFLKAEKSLACARQLGEGSIQFYAAEQFRLDFSAQKSLLLLAFTSDRGLCGSMHSKVCRRAKSFLEKNRDTYDLVCIGEKGKAQLLTDFGHSISLVVNGLGHRIPTFLDASRIVHKLATKYDYAHATAIYCRFRNLLSFKVSEIDVYGFRILQSSPAMLRYECDNDDVRSFAEFSTAAIVYYCLVETYATELASRIQAMSNSSKNAGELANKLNVECNRRRQAAITMDLIDVISGAAVVKK